MATKDKVQFRMENVGESEWKRIPYYIEQYDKLHEQTGEQPFVDTSNRLTFAEFEIVRDMVRSEIRAGWEE